MTLTELRYVIALARERHFGKAAAACHVSQPTLSVAISKLEAELGTYIFERDRNELRLTEVGEKIIVQAQRALDEAARVKQIAQTSSQSQLNTPLKLGAIYTIAPYLFPNVIPQLRKVAPDMPLLIQEDFTANLKAKLQQGDLDAIFIALPFSAPGIVTRELYDEPFVILMRRDHPLSDLESVAASQLPSDEILLLGEGHCFREQVLEACPNCYQGSDVQNTVEGTSLETLRHIVASGMGITVLPSTATQIDYYKSILCTRPFKGIAPKRRVALAWRTSFTRTKAIDALIKALQSSKLHGASLLDE
jgi:LysR family hydrogen peroxide-inducible transcriptional activator